MPLNIGLLVKDDLKRTICYGTMLAISKFIEFNCLYIRLL